MTKLPRVYYSKCGRASELEMTPVGSTRNFFFPSMHVSPTEKNHLSRNLLFNVFLDRYIDLKLGVYVARNEKKIMCVHRDMKHAGSLESTKDA